MRDRSAGRHLDRPEAKYRSTSIYIYILYDKPCLCAELFYLVYDMASADLPTHL